MHLEQLEIDYDFRTIIVDGVEKEELIIYIGNSDENLVYHTFNHDVPLDVTNPLRNTWPIAVYVKESATPALLDPIVFDNTNMINDSIYGEFAEIYCYFTPLGGSGSTVKRRKTTVKVTSGGGGGIAD